MVGGACYKCDRTTCFCTIGFPHLFRYSTFVTIQYTVKVQSETDLGTVCTYRRSEILHTTYDTENPMTLYKRRNCCFGSIQVIDFRFSSCWFGMSRCWRTTPHQHDDARPSSPGVAATRAAKARTYTIVVIIIKIAAFGVGSSAEMSWRTGVERRRWTTTTESTQPS